VIVIQQVWSLVCTVVLCKSNSNGFANGLGILVFGKNFKNLLSNGLANGLGISINLAKTWDGLAYMRACARLRIPSRALLLIKLNAVADN